MTKDVFGSAFPLASFEAWRSLVEKSLKGGSFEETLYAELPGGMSVPPLYVRESLTSSAEGAEAVLSRAAQQFPFPATKAELATRIDAPLIAGAVAQLRSDAEGGAGLGIVVLDRFTRLGLPRSSAEKEICADGLSLYSTEELGVLLSSAKSAKLPLLIDVGVNALSFGALLASRPSEEREMVAGVWCDPLASLVAQKAPFSSWSSMCDEMALVFSELGSLIPRAPLFAVDARAVHEAGASAVQELSYILSHALTLFRELEARGIDPRRVAERLQVVVSIGPDFFLELAKLRALRVLWANIAEPLGVSVPLHVTSVTARWNRTRDDPHTNLLRATSESLAALCAGVDRLVVLPFLLRGDGEEALARRMSRSVHHVLHEEALLGKVQDPGAGSYYAEALTKELCERAWAHFQGIESSGGLRSVLDNGSFQAEVAQLREARAQEVRSGAHKIVGLNAFRDASELSRLAAYDEQAARNIRVSELRSLSQGAPLSKFPEMIEQARAGVPLPALTQLLRSSTNNSGPAWTPSPLEPWCAQRVVDASSKSQGGRK
jgi:methylmalonyl-CoA mutase